MRSVDVLLVTALKDEYDAARQAATTACAGNPGVATWTPQDLATPVPYLLGDYVLADGARMSIALARPTRMGGTATAPIVSALVERLRPACLAMCGVCAGDPASVALGDVIIAELVYTYDEGKRTQQSFEADHLHVPMQDTWIRTAQEMSPKDLPSFGQPSTEDARTWLLERLEIGEDPKAHPAIRRYFNDTTWNSHIEDWIRDGLLARGCARFALTGKGRSLIERGRYDSMYGPRRLPFEIAVGPMASGNVVVKDGFSWDQLKRLGVRSVLGVEMEAATIASTAHRLDVANWVVAKGVMDYADPRKDDRYKQFAARASAEVLFKFLATRRPSQGATLNRGRAPASDHQMTWPRGPSTAMPVVARQLPLGPPYFVGREKELAALSTILDGSAKDGQARVAGIVGAGGIGKTWLALRWAHRHADCFPDGQIYLDLRSLAPDEAMTPATAAQCLLDALCVDPRAVPAGLDSQIGLYRSLIAGRRMLVVLENARDATQVAPLLPGTGSCAVLVTSRNRLDGLVVAAGAARVELGQLTESEAYALFAQQVGQARISAEPDATASLLKSCAGLPLALGVVVNRATALPDFPLTVLAAELSNATGVEAFDSGDKSTSLDRVFSWSYNALDADEATAFRLLSLVPGPDISMRAAASLFGLPIHKTRTTLSALEQMSLIHQRQPYRWQMDALVRLYAATRPDDQSAQDLAVRRLVDHYLHTAYAADRMVNADQTPIALGASAHGCEPEPIGDIASALAWFDEENAGLQAVLRLTESRGWHLAAWQLAWGMRSYHWRRARLADRVATWRIGLDAARHLDDAHRRHAHRMLGSALSRTGDHDEALEHLHSALRLSVELADPIAEAEVHRTLARAYGHRDEHEAALEHALAALRRYQSVEASRHEADTLDLVCWIRAQLGHYEQAELDGRAALELYRRCDDIDGEATALDTMGYIAQRTDRYAEAVGYYRQALGLFSGRNVYHEANTLDRLGETYTLLGDHDQAREAWERCLELLAAQQRTADIGRVRNRLGSAAR